jgi:hypothetical protein
MINMNRLLPLILVSATFLFSSKEVGAQVITLGTTADFVLFSSNGAITNTGASHLTGHVGTNAGSSTGFGNVDGIMHDQDGASALAMADLNVLYGQCYSNTFSCTSFREWFDIGTWCTLYQSSGFTGIGINSGWSELS